MSDLGGGGAFPAWALLLVILLGVAILLWLYSMQRKRKTVAIIEGAETEGSTPPPTDWSTPVDADAPQDTGPSSGDEPEAPG